MYRLRQLPVARSRWSRHCCLAFKEETHQSWVPISFIPTWFQMQLKNELSNLYDAGVCLHKDVPAVTRKGLPQHMFTAFILQDMQLRRGRRLPITKAANDKYSFI